MSEIIASLLVFDCESDLNLSISSKRDPDIFADITWRFSMVLLPCSVYVVIQIPPGIVY